jgi:hypothetical protein
VEWLIRLAPKGLTFALKSPVSMYSSLSSYTWTVISSSVCMGTNTAYLGQLDRFIKRPTAPTLQLISLSSGGHVVHVCTFDFYKPPFINQIIGCDTLLTYPTYLTNQCFCHIQTARYLHGCWNQQQCETFYPTPATPSNLVRLIICKIFYKSEHYYRYQITHAITHTSTRIVSRHFNHFLPCGIRLHLPGNNRHELFSTPAS